MDSSIKAPLDNLIEALLSDFDSENKSDSPLKNNFFNSFDNLDLFQYLEQTYGIEDKMKFALKIWQKAFSEVNYPVALFDNDAKLVFDNEIWHEKFTFLQDANSEVNKSFYKNIKKLIATSKSKKKSKSSEFNDQLKSINYKVFPFKFFTDQGTMVLIIAHSLLNNGSENLLPIIEKNKLPNYTQNLLPVLDGFYFSLNASGRITDIAIGSYNKLGYEQQSFINKEFQLILTVISKAAFQKVWNEILLTNFRPGFCISVELDLKRERSGSVRFDVKLVVPQEYNDNCRVVGYCLDINKYRLKELKLNKEKDKAESSDQLKSAFLADMSHELRTPLNGIIGFSSMLDRNDLVPEKREKYMHIIRSCSRQLLTLVNDIIDLSKIDAGQLKIVYHAVSLKQLINDLHLSTSAEAMRLEKVNVHLRKSIPRTGNDIQILTDEIRLKQVMGNFISNALKFTNKGEIVFGYRFNEDASEVCFFVTDSGIGIHEDSLKIIFDRFKQTNEGAKNYYNGTGLGLAICKGIVDLLGGKIGVKSKIDHGTEFFFTIPVYGTIVNV